MKKGRPLDAGLREKAFVKWYVEAGQLSAKECAIRAGYSPSSASNVAVELLKRPRIQEAIEALKQELGEFNYVVRLPIREREKLFSEYYEKWYREEFERRLSQMGPEFRANVLNRRNYRMDKKRRQLGNIDYNFLHDKSVAYAMEKCIRAFGDVNRKKKRYDKFRKDSDRNKWQYRSVRGCAY